MRGLAKPFFTISLLFFVLVSASGSRADSADGGAAQTDVRPTADPAGQPQRRDSEEKNEDSAGALARYEAGLKAAEAVGNKKAAANNLLGMGWVNMHRGDYSKAMAVFERAKRLAEELQDKLVLARTLGSMGEVQEKVGRYGEAKKNYQLALKLSEEEQDKSVLGQALRGMGNICFWQGDYPSAVDHYQRALALAQEQGDKGAITDALNGLGSVQLSQGSHKEAVDYYQRALNLAQEQGDKRRIARLLTNLASTYFDLELYEQALQRYQRALPIMEDLGDKRGLASTLKGIGLVYWREGLYRESGACYRRALKMSEDLGDRNGIAVALNNIGLLYVSQGLYGKAAEPLQRALKVAEDLGDKGAMAKTSANVGLVYWKQGSYGKAIEQYQRARKMNEEMKNKNGMAIAFYNIGLVYKSQELYREAIEYYQKALEIGQQINAKRLIGYIFNGIGGMHLRQQDFTQAVETLQRALALGEELKDPIIIWQANYNLALGYEKLGHSTQALNHYQSAIAQIEKVRAQTDSEEEKAGFLADKIDAFTGVIRSLHTLELENPAAGYGQQAFAYAERAKARAFLDLLSEARIDPEQGLTPELIERKRTLQTRLATAQKNLRRAYEKGSPDARRIKTLEEELGRVDEEYAGLTADIRRRHPHYASLQYPQPLGLSEVQRLLDSETALLEYALGKEASYLFVVTGRDYRMYSLPAEERLFERVNALRHVLQKPDPVWQATERSHSRYVELAKDLYTALVKPAEFLLSGKRRLIIVPDGVLYYLPFETLLTAGGKRAGTVDFNRLPYLVHDYEIHYAPSATVWATLRGRPAEGTEGQRKELLAVADPLYQTTRSADRPGGDSDANGIGGIVGPEAVPFDRLPNTRLEVEGIAALYPKDQVSVFVGRAASERNVKRMKLDEYKRLHFATHGVLNEERPQFSALVLSLEGEGDEDGYLTMREIFDLKLKADLVVLSACQTGLGQQIRGEGVRGLARAFLYAGTPRVVVSLWNVADRSTARWMKSFYGHMAGHGMKTAAALRHARLEMIRGGRYSHPYYWAPFVLMGDE